MMKKRDLCAWSCGQDHVVVKFTCTRLLHENYTNLQIICMPTYIQKSCMKQYDEISAHVNMVNNCNLGLFLKFYNQIQDV